MLPGPHLLDSFGGDPPLFKQEFEHLMLPQLQERFHGKGRQRDETAVWSENAIARDRVDVRMPVCEFTKGLDYNLLLRYGKNKSHNKKNQFRNEALFFNNVTIYFCKEITLFGYAPKFVSNVLKFICDEIFFVAIIIFSQVMNKYYREKGRNELYI